MDGQVEMLDITDSLLKNTITFDNISPEEANNIKRELSTLITLIEEEYEDEFDRYGPDEFTQGLYDKMKQELKLLTLYNQNDYPQYQVTIRDCFPSEKTKQLLNALVFDPKTLYPTNRKTNHFSSLPGYTVLIKTLPIDDRKRVISLLNKYIRNDASKDLLLATASKEYVNYFFSSVNIDEKKFKSIDSSRKVISKCLKEYHEWRTVIVYFKWRIYKTVRILMNSISTDLDTTDDDINSENEDFYFSYYYTFLNKFDHISLKTLSKPSPSSLSRLSLDEKRISSFKLLLKTHQKTRDIYKKNTLSFAKCTNVNIAYSNGDIIYRYNNLHMLHPIFSNIAQEVKQCLHSSSVISPLLSSINHVSRQELLSKRQQKHSISITSSVIFPSSISVDTFKNTGEVIDDNNKDDNKNTDAVDTMLKIKNILSTHELKEYAIIKKWYFEHWVLSSEDIPIGRTMFLKSLNEFRLNSLKLQQLYSSFNDNNNDNKRKKTLKITTMGQRTAFYKNIIKLLRIPKGRNRKYAISYVSKKRKRNTSHQSSRKRHKKY